MSEMRFRSLVMSPIAAAGTLPLLSARALMRSTTAFMSLRMSPIVSIAESVSAAEPPDPPSNSKFRIRNTSTPPVGRCDAARVGLLVRADQSFERRIVGGTRVAGLLHVVCHNSFVESNISDLRFRGRRALHVVELRVAILALVGAEVVLTDPPLCIRGLLEARPRAGDLRDRTAHAGRSEHHRAREPALHIEKLLHRDGLEADQPVPLAQAVLMKGAARLREQVREAGAVAETLLRCGSITHGGLAARVVEARALLPALIDERAFEHGGHAAEAVFADATAVVDVTRQVLAHADVLAADRTVRADAPPRDAVLAVHTHVNPAHHRIALRVLRGEEVRLHPKLVTLRNAGLLDADDARVEERADRERARVVRGHDRLAGNQFGDLFERILREPRVVEVAGAVAQLHAADVDVLGLQCRERIAIDAGHRAVVDLTGAREIPGLTHCDQRMAHVLLVTA